MQILSLLILMAVSVSCSGGDHPPEVNGPETGALPQLPDPIRYNDLEWMVGPDSNTSWDAAVRWVESLGDRWRMPTPDELRALYDSGVDPDDWGPFQNSGYGVWSGELFDPASAWLFNFFRGFELWIERDETRYIRAFAVRP